MELLFKKFNLLFDPIEFKLYDLHTGIYPAAGDRVLLLTFLDAGFDGGQSIALDGLHITIASEENSIVAPRSISLVCRINTNDGYGRQVHDNAVTELDETSLASGSRYRNNDCTSLSCADQKGKK